MSYFCFRRTQAVVSIEDRISIRTIISRQSHTEWETMIEFSVQIRPCVVTLRLVFVHVRSFVLHVACVFTTILVTRFPLHREWQLVGVRLTVLYSLPVTNPLL